MMNFKAKIDELKPMLQWIRGNLQGVDLKMLQNIELACEEVLVNIIEHAYHQKGGVVEIDVFDFPKDHVEIHIRDEGTFFNPLDFQDAPKSPLPIDLQEEGGLGIHFMKKIMDDIRYTRSQNKNILILVKKYPIDSSR